MILPHLIKFPQLSQAPLPFGLEIIFLHSLYSISFVSKPFPVFSAFQKQLIYLPRKKTLSVFDGSASDTFDGGWDHRQKHGEPLLGPHLDEAAAEAGRYLARHSPLQDPPRHKGKDLPRRQVEQRLRGLHEDGVQGGGQAGVLHGVLARDTCVIRGYLQKIKMYRSERE